MTEIATSAMIAQAEAARQRLTGLSMDELPPGIDPDYYQEDRIRPPSRRPVQQGTIVDVSGLITSQGGADYA